MRMHVGQWTSFLLPQSYTPTPHVDILCIAGIYCTSPGRKFPLWLSFRVLLFPYNRSWAQLGSGVTPQLHDFGLQINLIWTWPVVAVFVPTSISRFWLLLFLLLGSLQRLWSTPAVALCLKRLFFLLLLLLSVGFLSLLHNS